MRDALPSRRAFLAGGLATVTSASAGCLGVFQDSEPTDPRELQLALDQSSGTLRERYVFDREDPPTYWVDGALEAALTDESFTVTGRRPFGPRPEESEYVHDEGTYYLVDAVVVDETSDVRPVLRLSTVDAEPNEVDAISAETLPEIDQQAVDVAWKAARARGNVGGVPWGLVQRGGFVYPAEGSDRSRLLGADALDRIEYRGNVYAVTVARETFHRPVYRPTAHAVATTEGRMEAILRAQLVDARFDRDDVSDAAHEIIIEATQTSYAESHPYSTEYRDLLRAMHKRGYIDGNIEKDAGLGDSHTGTIRYDDIYYEYDLRFVGGAE